MILFGEASLRKGLTGYGADFHGKRNHQGKGNVILFPKAEDQIGASTDRIQTRQRLGGLLKFYYREAACGRLSHLPLSVALLTLSNDLLSRPAPSPGNRHRCSDLEQPHRDKRRNG